MILKNAFFENESNYTQFKAKKGVMDAIITRVIEEKKSLILHSHPLCNELLRNGQATTLQLEILRHFEGITGLYANPEEDDFYYDAYIRSLRALSPNLDVHVLTTHGLNYSNSPAEFLVYYKTWVQEV